MGRLMYGPTPRGKRFFASSFQPNTTINAFGGISGGGATQQMSGTDLASGYAWPIKVFKGSTTQLQCLSGQSSVTTANALAGYTLNGIQSVPGPYGAPAAALFQELITPGNLGTQSTALQNAFQIITGAASPSDETPIYMAYDIYWQPDLAARMVNSFNVLTEFKTSGDFRIITFMSGDGSGNLTWFAQADNNANGNLTPATFWQMSVSGSAFPVPIGTWAHVEIYFRRVGDGVGDKYWVAINGKELFYKTGVSFIGVNSAPINRIMITNTYTDASLSGPFPLWHRVANLELWDDWPVAPRVPVWQQ